MENFIANGEKSCRIYHRWELMFNKDNNRYFECKDCGSRKVNHPSNGGMVRFRWLNGETNQVKKVKNKEKA